MVKVRAWRVSWLAAGWLPRLLCAQQTPPAVPDTTPRFTLSPITVSVTRAPLLLTKTPLAIQIVGRDRISRGRPIWGLDEALIAVPGVYVANRYNFSLDQRLSIRGFGSRAAFAVRGVKVLLDGIPQTLPDGQGQLTNLELGSADRIEVLRGSSSALYGNAAGGVISIWTDPPAAGAPPPRASEEVRVLAGRSEQDTRRAWSKWQSTTRVRLGQNGGMAQLTASRLGYDGERDHSGADFRNLNGHLQLPLGRWSLTAVAAVGDDPRADNPGALTLAELRANRDSAAAINLLRDAGKDVTQAQGGLTLRRAGANGAELTATLFGLTRSLTNPQTFAYIDLDRIAYGARITASQPVRWGPRPQRLTVGVDVQRQRDDRVNLNYVTPTGAQRDTSRQLDQLEHVTEVGPFVQHAIDLTPHASLTAGLRYDRVAFRVDDRLVTGTNPDDSGRRLMSALSGSIGLAVSPRDAVTVYGNVGSSFETPTTTELANRPDTAGGFNPTLNPQHAVNYEVGLRARTAHGDVSWSLALFQADVRDELISYEVPSAPARRFFRNAGSARHRGVEVGVDLALLRGVSFSGTYTYADYRYVRYRFSPDTARTFVLDGRALPGIPPSTAHLALRANPGGVLGRGAWGELETTYSAAYLVDDTLGTRTSPWWETNLRLGWEGTVAGTRLGPFVGVNNLFNRLYVGSVTINAARGRYYEPAPGRSLYLGVTFGAAR
jgi:iron complex outermembrane recepter protein